MSMFSGFYKKSIEERRKLLTEFANIGDQDISKMENGGLPLELADRMVENVIGTFSLPYSVATNFIIDGVEKVIPMVTEETSVVAAASNGARLCVETGGFRTSVISDLMIGQVQLLDIQDKSIAVNEIERMKQELIEIANSKDPFLVKIGGVDITHSLNGFITRKNCRNHLHQDS